MTTPNEEVVMTSKATSPHQQDSEKVSTILFMKMTESNIRLHAATPNEFYKPLWKILEKPFHTGSGSTPKRAMGIFNNNNNNKILTPSPIFP